MSQCSVYVCVCDFKDYRDAALFLGAYITVNPIRALFFIIKSQDRDTMKNALGRLNFIRKNSETIILLFIYFAATRCIYYYVVDGIGRN